DPGQSVADAGEIRARLGISAERVLIVAAVGGTAVGWALLQRIIASFELAPHARPELPLIAVGGPRHGPPSLPRAGSVDARGYVPDLYQVLAASDLALVQGGLASTMEACGVASPLPVLPAAAPLRTDAARSASIGQLRRAW